MVCIIKSQLLKTSTVSNNAGDCVTFEMSESELDFGREETSGSNVGRHCSTSVMSRRNECISLIYFSAQGRRIVGS